MQTSSLNKLECLDVENISVRCDGRTLTIEVPITKPTSGRGDGCKAAKLPNHPTLQPDTENKSLQRQYATASTSNRFSNGARGSATVDLTGGVYSDDSDTVYSDTSSRYNSDE